MEALSVERLRGLRLLCGPFKVPVGLLLGLLLAGPALAQEPPLAVYPAHDPTPDATGAYTVELDLQAWPQFVKGGDTFDQEYTWDLPPNTRVRRVRSFLAFDRGNVAEGHALTLADSFYLAETGPHHEKSGTYDAWSVEPTDYVSGDAGAVINFHVLCRPTLPGKSVKCEAGLVLELVPMQ